jgi:hypothetical protein
MAVRLYTSYSCTPYPVNRVGSTVRSNRCNSMYSTTEYLQLYSRTTYLVVGTTEMPVCKGHEGGPPQHEGGRDRRPSHRVTAPALDVGALSRGRLGGARGRSAACVRGAWPVQPGEPHGRRHVRGQQQLLAGRDLPSRVCAQSQPHRCARKQQTAPRPPPLSLLSA